MAGELLSCAGKIKSLREQLGMKQAELAKKLNLTRASVNGWEMGLTVPATSTIIELAKVFHVSTDYLLGMEYGTTLKIDGLSQKEVAILADLVSCFLESSSNNGLV